MATNDSNPISNLSNLFSRQRMIPVAVEVQEDFWSTASRAGAIALSLFLAVAFPIYIPGPGLIFSGIFLIIAYSLYRGRRFEILLQVPPAASLSNVIGDRHHHVGGPPPQTRMPPVLIPQPTGASQQHHHVGGGGQMPPPSQPMAHPHQQQHPVGNQPRRHQVGGQPPRSTSVPGLPHHTVQEEQQARRPLFGTQVNIQRRFPQQTSTYTTTHLAPPPMQTVPHPHAAPIGQRPVQTHHRVASAAREHRWFCCC